MSKILIVEDDKEINALLSNVVQSNDYRADTSFDGFSGLQMALEKDYGLILLDLMLPYKTGEEFIRQLRVKKNTPVIILSAKDTTYNKIELLRLGADDYITKPLDIDEVLLRMEAVLRRTEHLNANGSVLDYRDIRVYLDSKRIFLKNMELECTAMEYAILELLLRNPTKIFSKRNLFESVTGEDYMVDENTINVHISNIRKKLKNITSEQYIETVYGMGYRLIT